MKIEKNKIIALDYEILDLNHNLLDKMQDLPIFYLHGGYDDIFRKVEDALEGKTIGEEIDLILEPDDAFGEINPDLIQTESFVKLSQDIGEENIQIGMLLEAFALDNEHPILYRITDITADTIILDANPPLAGQTLRFKAKIISIEPANEEQIAFGSANVPHQQDGNCAEEGCNCSKDNTSTEEHFYH